MQKLMNFLVHETCIKCTGLDGCPMGEKILVVLN